MYFFSELLAVSLLLPLPLEETKNPSSLALPYNILRLSSLLTRVSLHVSPTVKFLPL